MESSQSPLLLFAVRLTQLDSAKTALRIEVQSACFDKIARRKTTVQLTVRMLRLCLAGI